MTEPNETDKENNHWEKFKVWAALNGVSLEDLDDYAAWWDCWSAGVFAEYEYERGD